MRTGSTASRLAGARGRQLGFAYVLLLVAVALIGAAASAAVSLGATMARRDAEQQLLTIGAEFEQALRSYAGVPVGAAGTTFAAGPATLDDLLRDPRAPGIRRHLRQIYADPLTGKAEWGLLRNEQGLIVGIHSMATAQPIKQQGWPAQWRHFAGAERYTDWVFGFTPQPKTANGTTIR